jgi:ABC-2 type transport system ATP-binding protein
VFVSSHILSEVEQMCDDVAILKTGRLIAQGPVASVVSASGRAASVLLRTTDDDGAIAALRAMPWVTSVRREDGRLVVDAPLEHTSDISRTLAERQIWLSELRASESSLEEAFMEITAGEETPNA